MKIHLKELFDIVGEVKEFDYEITPEQVGEYSSYDFTAPIAVSGRAENRAGVVTLDFGVKFGLSQVCDRCLKEFEREYAYEFSHILVRQLHSGRDDYDEYVVCEDNVLELDELVISDMLLSLPTKILCKEDCKGLCFKCGKDLNEGDCDCPKD
ncbi:YceD family protein [Ruminococcus albus]|uniref:ACR, COG1399 n=1 Tax=Ruminococcus albus 8 TaxID=246199 RepID=E9SHM5_RUMAL|nr:DUF177 domain-containing protein [Ruminococcus albus]EGC01114.1 hypothetical protein CUS_6974 [Ruminococcus albus 8]MCC3349588.1 DUF177 domain-containing protein [Ruminococcus albus 8]